ncbi:MAG TPA: T9SS type A sorting domain-containing protein, partial [Chitinophagales bacterium]|nr:T9SS type A sorting domain-containing protein [Chitinophagales bacterium]
QVSDTTAIVSWSPLRDAAVYLIQYQVTGAMKWDSVQVPADTTVFLLEHLIPATNYSWIIQAFCSEGKKAAAVTGIQSFTTLPAEIDSVVLDIQISVFPNPATDEVYCLVKQNGSAAVEVMLSDLVGRERFRSEFKMIESGQQVTIPVEGLARGLYFLKVMTGNQERVIKLVLN